MKRCTGYTSDGSAGITYSQAPHFLDEAGLNADGKSNFPGKKSQCRVCYGVYAKDWRAKRGIGGKVSKRKTSVHAKPTSVTLPNFSAPALELDEDEVERVSEEDLARSQSHAFVPQPDLIETWAAVCNAMANGSHPFNLMFLGPSGSGKTEAGQFLAGEVGLPFTKVDAPSMTDPESWFGTREVIVEDGVSVTAYRPSTFVLAIEQPGVLMIDEANRVRDDHRNGLLGLLDGTHQVTNPLTGDVVTKHPRCIIIMTGNQGLRYTGTYAMDPALLTRSIVVNFEYAEAEAEIGIAMDSSGCSRDVAELFVKFAAESRIRAEGNPDYSPISTREIIAACKLVSAGLSPDVAARVTVINAASPEGGAESPRAGLEIIWNGIRTNATGSASTITTPCGSEHSWKLDSNRNPLRCALPQGLHLKHQAVNGELWDA